MTEPIDLVAKLIEQAGVVASAVGVAWVTHRIAHRGGDDEDPDAD